MEGPPAGPTIEQGQQQGVLRMLFWGVLGILQATLLPGLVLVRLLRLSDGALKALVYAFVLSLLVNHLFVFAAVVLGIYETSVVRGLLIAEAVALLWLYRDALRGSLPSVMRPDTERAKALARQIGDEPNGVRHLQVTFAVAGLLALACFIGAGFTSAQAVFDKWDAVVSWNPWAVSWAEGEIPRRTWNYPQLLPTATSLPYAITGQTHVQFFAKAIYGLFPLAMLLALVDLALRLREPAYLLAMATAGGLLYAFMPEYVNAGFADAPVAALVLISAYCLLLARNGTDRRTVVRDLAMSAMALAAALGAKQAAGLFLPGYLLLAIVASFPRDLQFKWRTRVLVGVGLLVAALLLASPWYVYSRVVDTGSEIQHVMFGAAHGGRGYAQRLETAINWLGMTPLLGTVGGAIAFVATFAAGQRDRFWRWATIGTTLPGFLMWCFFFSYDRRNAAVVLPLAGTTAAVGAGVIVVTLRRFCPRDRQAAPWSLAYTVVVLAGCVAIAGTDLRRRTLVAEQDAQQRYIYDAHTNLRLYDYYYKGGFAGNILSNYQIMGFLPVFDQLYRLDHFHDVESMERKIRSENIRHLLVLDFGRECVPYLREQVEKGRFRMDMLQTNCYIFTVVNPQ